jgi:ribosomal protein L11 methyltransferase
LGTVCGAVSAFEQAQGGAWLVEGFAASAPDRALVETALALAWAQHGAPAPAPSIERVPPRDWLAENQASFVPLIAGRYFIHGSHFRGDVPAGRVALTVDAATAFGTGEHAGGRGAFSTWAPARAFSPSPPPRPGTGVSERATSMRRRSASHGAMPR